MSDEQEVLWTDGKSAILQVSTYLVVVHYDCRSRDASSGGYWLWVPHTPERDVWICAGDGCSEKLLFGPGSEPKTARLKFQEVRDNNELEEWASKWIGVGSEFVKVDIE